jgi:hypothetical protein
LSETTCSERTGRLIRLANAYGVSVSDTAVCEGHSAPIDFLESWVYDRPSLSLVHGPRGGGKSYLAAFATHLDSIIHDRHGTKILGGSASQSAQIYEALADFRECESLGKYNPFTTFNATSAQYETGSSVGFIAASPKSVRGPHVATLRLDEVDEIDSEIREAAMGMVMELRGVRPSVTMTSTWHRIGGPMATLVEEGKAGKFPVHSFCAFEVLERCPEERSGPALEKCPECPLMKWCHSDMGSHPSGVPKAKRSRGHYTIDSLLQKAQAVSLRVFESDYLCLRPKAAGLWFTMFDESVHVTSDAEFNYIWPTHLSIDPGVETGAVWFQTRPRRDGNGIKVTVFADYYNYDSGPEVNAQAIMGLTESFCGVGVPHMRVTMDPAGKHRNAGGRIVAGEYERAGLRGRNGLEVWPMGDDFRKGNGLALLEALLRASDGTVSLTIHPRCQGLIRALQSYQRKSIRGQWLDEPIDPCHPHEEYIDSLCGGLKSELPGGRTPQPKLRQVRNSPTGF